MNVASLLFLLELSRLVFYGVCFVLACLFCFIADGFCMVWFQELVTFSSHPLLSPPDVSNAGRHLSAVEFHSVLQSAGK